MADSDQVSTRAATMAQRFVLAGKSRPVLPRPGFLALVLQMASLDGLQA